MKIWRVPFSCCYQDYELANPKDRCVSMEGSISVEAENAEEAIQRAEIRMGQFGFGHVLIFEDFCSEESNYLM